MLGRVGGGKYRAGMPLLRGRDPWQTPPVGRGSFPAGPETAEHPCPSMGLALRSSWLPSAQHQALHQPQKVFVD